MEGGWLAVHHPLVRVGAAADAGHWELDKGESIAGGTLLVQEFSPKDHSGSHVEGLPFHGEEMIRVLIDGVAAVHDESGLYKPAASLQVVMGETTQLAHVSSWPS